MILTFDDGAESTFANLLNDFKSVGNLVALLQSVVALLIVEAIVDEALQFGRLIFDIVSSHVPNFVVFRDF